MAEILIVAVLLGIGWMLHRSFERRERSAAVLGLLQAFGPAQATVQHDPKQLLAWYPLAEASRKVFPEAFAVLDSATGARFPFARDVVERAHAKVTAEWLAWEKAHDEEYRIKAAAAEQAMQAASGDAASLARARLDRVQHEKIERYQQRYEDYVRSAKALQALLQ